MRFPADAQGLEEPEDLVGTAVFLVFVVKEGVAFVLDSYGQTTTYLNLPISYSYAAIPASGVLMLYYLLRRGSSLLRGDRPIDSAHHEGAP
jgi:TRAP-type C4-dicarboxylate transport system permease small subunit